MITLKCNMCNANLVIEEGAQIVICEFCGAAQTLPEKKGDNSIKRGYMLLEEGRFEDANGYFCRALDENAQASDAYLGKVLVEVQKKTKEEFFDLDNLTELELVLKNIKYSTDYKNAIRFAGSDMEQQLEKYREDVYELAYNKAFGLMKEREYYSAISWFKWIEEYKDTANLLMDCQALLKNQEQDENYKKAVEYMEKQAYSNAIGLFEDISEYKDSVELIKECKYRKATNYKKSEEYMDAIEVFKDIIDYKDSKQKLRACENVVKDRRYLYAKDKLQNSGTDMEVESAKGIFEKLMGYKDSDRLIVECDKEITYLKAKQTMLKVKTVGAYKEACRLFETIAEYKDASKLAKKCRFYASVLKFVWIPITFLVVLILLMVII